MDQDCNQIKLVNICNYLEQRLAEACPVSDDHQCENFFFNF